MAAAAEAALPNAESLHQAHTFAAVIWERFSSHLLDAKNEAQKQFASLVHQLGMKELALCIADRLNVCTQRPTDISMLSLQ